MRPQCKRGRCSSIPRWGAILIVFSGACFLAHAPLVSDGSRWLITDAKVNKSAAWVVCEKVHGSNFCISSDGHAVRTAKRSAWLEDGNDEGFFECAEVVALYGPRVVALQQRLTALLPGAAPVVWVYGELYGGLYPGHGGSAETAVQQEIFYTASVDWIAFDCAYSSSGALADAQFLRYSELRAHCAAVAIPTLEPLLQGPLNRCMSFSPAFPTTLPARLGLPAVAHNDAEGVVIRLDAPARTGPFEVLIGDAKGLPCRPLAKNKCARFSEVVARGATANPRERLNGYVTAARWGNVVSKLGKRFDESKARRLFAQDVLEEASLQDAGLAEYIATRRDALLVEMAASAPVRK